MRISYIVGICVKNDAISASVRAEMQWLMSTKEHELNLFTYACDFADLPHTVVQGNNDLLLHWYFQQSDLIVYHYGIYSPLFDMALLMPKNAKKTVVFHNITPKQFLPKENHGLIDSSFKQLSTFQYFNKIAADSQVNKDVLIEHGITIPITVLPLSCEYSLTHRVKPSSNDGIVRLLFVGRFVQSKGILDLFTALKQLAQKNQQLKIKFDLVGNLLFSDQAIVQKMHQLILELASSHSNLSIHLHGNAVEADKIKLLQEADIFVLPSYHEGFCVPILEAFAYGCRVICYDNSNLPYITNGFAELVPTGDVHSLSKQLNEMVATCSSSTWHSNTQEGYADYEKKVQEYVSEFSEKKCKKRFLNFIASL